MGRLGIAGRRDRLRFPFRASTGRARRTYLAEQGKRLGFAVDVVPRFEDEGRPVSFGSRSARRWPAASVGEAHELLGYPWFVSGEVVHGDKRGRELGYPDRQSAARPGLRPQARHLCGAGRDRRAALRRRRELRAAADVRRRHRAARSVPVRFFRRPLRRRRSTSPSSTGSGPSSSSTAVEELVRRMDEDSRLARAALARAPDAFPPLGNVS